MKAQQRVYDLERRMEGLRLTAYPDPESPLGKACTARGLDGTRYAQIPSWRCLPGEPWTVGYGHTKGVHSGDQITRDFAEHLLAGDIADAETYLSAALLMVPVTQGQFDALVDFVFQFGATKFSQSTLYQRLLQHDFNDAAKELLRWVHDGAHNVLPELVERRTVAHGWFTESEHVAA